MQVTGDLVHQRYKIGKVLGKGSSAMVYEATHKRSKLGVGYVARVHPYPPQPW